jgi:hypothetical protein
LEKTPEPAGESYQTSWQKIPSAPAINPKRPGNYQRRDWQKIPSAPAMIADKSGKKSQTIRQ